MEGQIQLIKMDLIDRPVKMARELIDPEKIRELAESIREVGLLEPVLLASRNGRYEMVAGDRRYLAHKLLNFKEIKAIIRELDDREIVVIRGIENLQRVDLTPSEEAMYYLTLHEEGGLSKKEICKKTGKAFGTVDRYLRFAKCPEEVRRAVDRKDISLNTLDILMEIDDPEAFHYHFVMASQNGITPPVARMWVDDYIKTKAGTYYNEDGNPPASSIEIPTRPVFMTCEVCCGPCEIHKVRNIVVCPDCGKKVKNSNVKTS